MGHTHTTIRLELCNEPESTRRLRAELEQVASSSDLTDEARFELKLAATEALTNAFKGTSDEHSVDVVIAGTAGAVDLELIDRGRFTPSVRSVESALEAEGGRGIPLMLALVDEVEFASFRDGTRVRMSKRAPRSGEGSPPFVLAASG
jgi:anti-sigma regulatory factor (Ser/Thr protein kinase)